MRRLLPPIIGRGMSIVEAVIVIGITAVLSVVINSIFVADFNLSQNQLSRIDAEGGAIAAIRTLGELTRGSTGIMTNWTVNGVAYTSDADQLVLRLPSLDVNGNPTGSERDYIAIYRDPANPRQILTNTEPSAVSARHNGIRLLTGYNDELVFSYNNVYPSLANRVSVFIVNSTTPPHAIVVSKAWTSIFMRNF
jgi:hypothetical protein